MAAINWTIKDEVCLFDNQPVPNRAIALTDEVVFNEVIADYSPKLFSIAFYVTKNHYISEDILQETFLKLWEKRAELIPDNIGGWLYKVVTNAAYKHLKKEARKKEVLYLLQAGKQSVYSEVEERLIHKQDLEAFGEIRSRLPQKQQEVYRLSREEGLKREEIAQHLNISSNTVRNHLASAVQFLKNHITIACLALLFFVFNNFFFNQDSTNILSRDLYKVNHSFNKRISVKSTKLVLTNNSISFIKFY